VTAKAAATSADNADEYAVTDFFSQQACSGVKSARKGLTGVAEVFDQYRGSF
jgi:hypothetical protein